jgi:hypothetical protein
VSGLETRHQQSYYEMRQGQGPKQVKVSLRIHRGATQACQEEALHLKRHRVGLSARAVREEGPSRNPIGASVTFYETKPNLLEVFH